MQNIGQALPRVLHSGNLGGKLTPSICLVRSCAQKAEEPGSSQSSSPFLLPIRGPYTALPERHIIDGEHRNSHPVALSPYPTVSENLILAENFLFFPFS